MSSDGTTVVAGAPYANVGSSYEGAVYVFKEPASGWTTGIETAKLTASDGAEGDRLGFSVALSSDGATVVAGAPGATVGSNALQGAMYVFSSSEITTYSIAGRVKDARGRPSPASP